MKKIFLIFVIIFSLFGVKVANAQTDKSLQDTVIELTQKVDSLQQNLTYLNICIELNDLKSLVEQFSNQITDDIYQINTSIQIDKYDKSDYNQSKQQYEQFDNKIKRMDELIKVKEFWVKNTSKSITDNSYKDDISNRLDLLDYSYDALKKHLQTFNEILETAKIIVILH